MTPVRRLFKNPVLNDEFREKGYVVIPAFLNQECVKDLQCFHDTYCIAAAGSFGFHASSHVKDSSHKQRVSEIINAHFLPNTSELLEDYRGLYGAFTVKEPDATSGVRSHMDWKMVDEDEFVSVSVWTSLVDTDMVNGHLWVLEGSHLLGRSFRGGPWNYTGITMPFAELGKSKFKKVELQLNAGDAVIYDHRTFHGSYPNFSKDRRVAINLTMLPKEVKSRHYYLKEDTINCIEVENDFYVKFELGTFPEGQVELGQISEKVFFLDQEEIDSMAIEPEVERMFGTTDVLRTSFNDTDLQNEFVINGFVKVPLLNAEEVNRLISIHEELPSSDLETTFYTTHWSRDMQHRKNVDMSVRPLLQGAVLPYLKEHKACVGIFLVKRPGEDGEFHVHQDWTLVEESMFRGITVWVALCDTDIDNGCLHVVPKSHLYCNNIRGENIEPPTHHIKSFIESDYCVPIPMKAGEAIFFDHRLLHYSPPNRTLQTRVSVGLVVIPQETTLIHYNRRNEQDELVTKYIANDDFLLEMGLGQLNPEKYDKVKEFEYRPYFHTEESFRDVSRNNS